MLAGRLARRKPERVVGYFRSHTRPGLFLDQDDFNVIRSYFPDPSHVFLVVRPSPEGPPTGGFFFWEEGDINRKAPYRQFPLDPERLLGGGSPVSRPFVAAAAPSASLPAGQRAAPVRQRIPQVPWLAVPIIAVFFLAAGLFVSQNRAPKKIAPAFTVSQHKEPGLLLDVVDTGSGLQVRWDANSAVIRKADLGILRITDGGRLSSRELEPQELAAGSTSYIPASKDVNFELRVYTLADKIAKSVPETFPEAVPVPERQVADAVGPAEAPGQAPSALAELPRTPSPSSADRLVPRKPSKAPPFKQAKLSHEGGSSFAGPAVKNGPVHAVDPPPLVAGGSLPQHSALDAVLSPRTVNVPLPHTEVSYEEPRHGPIRRLFQRLTLGDEADGFVPPAPVRRVTPPRPETRLTGTVDVKVYIDESGKVSRAQLLTKHNPLSEPALAAAREWSFTPARKHDKAVPSEMVLHFRFGGADM